MAKLAIKKASVDVSLYVFIQDSSSSTGAGLTGLVFNSASLTAYYVRPLGSATAITLATQTVTGAHSDGGFVEVSSTNMPGVYRLDLPDAVVASGVNAAVVMLKGATNMAALPLEIELVAYDPQDATSLGLSRLDAAVTTRASQTSLDTVDDFLDTEVAAIKAKTDQLTFTTANKVDSTIQAAGDFAQAAADKVWSTTTRAITDKAGFSLSSAGIQAIWDALTSALTTASSIGKLLVDNVNATISSRASQTSVDTVDDFLDTEIAAIKTKTDQLTFTTANKVDSTIQAAGDFAQAAADKVWSTTTRTLSAFGFSVTVGTNNDKTGYGLSSAAVQAVWDALTSALTTASSIGKLLVDNLNATVSSRASQTSVDTVDDFLDTEIAAIKAKTDNLPASPAATGDIPTANAIADQVWDEVLSGHLTAGSTGNALNAAGSSGDPWATALPGAYGSGSAGNIIGNRIDAAISTRLASASYTTPPTAAANADAVWDELRADHTTAGTFGQGAASVQGNVTGSVGSVTGNVGGNVAGSVASVTADVGITQGGADKVWNTTTRAITDKAGFSLSSAGVTAVWDEIMEASLTARHQMRIMFSALACKLSGAASTTIIVRNAADTKARITATVDSSGNRTAVTTDGT